MTKESKKSIVKNCVYDLLESTTAHGIPNILRSKRLIIKLFWTLCLLSSIATCAYIARTTILNYLDYGKNTEIATIYEEKSQFPTVSICNTPTDLARSILAFMFDQKIIYTMNSTDYFEEFTDPFYGNCFRFNSGKNRSKHDVDIVKSNMAGISYGFNLILESNLAADFNQIHLYIHNYTERPLTLLNKGFTVLSGTKSFFLVERTFNERLEFPYNDCLKDPADFKLNKTVINYFIDNNRTYSQKDCIPLCRNLLAFEKSPCGCNVSYVTADIECILKNKRQLMDKTEHGKCLQDFLKELQFNYEKCLNYCPLECDSITYSISSRVETITASGNITNTINDPEFKRFDSYEEIKKKYFSISIYYPELKYTFITQNPKMEMFDLVSNIGGILGLFIGVSFLSFIEIFELIFEVIFLLFENKIDVLKK